MTLVVNIQDFKNETFINRHTCTVDTNTNYSFTCSCLVCALIPNVEYVLNVKESSLWQGGTIFVFFVCVFLQMEVNGSTPISVQTITTLGKYDDIYHGSCCIDSSVRESTKKFFAVKHSVALSYDKVSFSQPKSVFVYNSDCQMVDSTFNNTGRVILKVRFCHSWLHLAGQKQ